MLSLAGLSPGQLAIRSLAVLSDGEHLGMLMLRFPLDESGDGFDPNERVVAVAGCIAPLQNWLDFDAPWKAVLDKFHVKASHLKDVMHSRREFEGWDEATRNSFLAALVSVIEDHIVPSGGFIGIAMPSSVKAREYSKMFDLYYPCLMMCLSWAATKMNQSGLPPEEKLEVILDRRSGYEHWRAPYLDGMAEDDPIVSPRLGTIVTNASYIDVRPLQAADLVAYSLTLHIKNLVYRKHESHWLMRRLLAQRLHHFLFFKRYTFEPPDVIDGAWQG